MACLCRVLLSCSLPLFDRLSITGNVVGCVHILDSKGVNYVK